MILHVSLTITELQVFPDEEQDETFTDSTLSESNHTVSPDREGIPEKVHVLKCPYHTVEYIQGVHCIAQLAHLGDTLISKAIQ